MDKLKICKNSRFFFGEDEVKRDSVNFTEFLIANLDNEVELEDGVTVEEVVHSFYDCRDFIYAYFSEHYEVLRALITVKNLQKNYHVITVSKKAHIDEGYIYLIPCVDFVVATGDQTKTNVLSKIKLVLNEELALMEDDIFTVDGDRNLKKKLKSKITLMDLMKALFEDLVLVIEENSINL